MRLNYNIQIDKSEIIINGDFRWYDESDKPSYEKLAEAILRYEKSKPIIDGVYNKAVHWPVGLEMAIEDVMQVRYEIGYTKHYYERCEQWDVPWSCYKAALYGEIIEAEIQSGAIVKIVTRLPNNKQTDEDICFAIMLDGNKATVKTVWCNMNYDNHYTIKKSNYVNEV